jgi:hypothetical protein
MSKLRGLTLALLLFAVHDVVVAEGSGATSPATCENRASVLGAPEPSWLSDPGLVCPPSNLLCWWYGSACHPCIQGGVFCDTYRCSNGSYYTCCSECQQGEYCADPWPPLEI